jgi:hypothetical protein
MEALNAAAACVEQKVPALEAMELVRWVLEEKPVEPTTECTVIRSAMTKILGIHSDAKVIPPARSSACGTFIGDTVAYAWLSLINGNAKVALDVLSRLRAEQHDHQSLSQKARKNSSELMSLYFWLTAVEAFAKGDKNSSRQYWLKSLDLGSHFGTETHLMVGWSYVATFFPSS